MKRYFNESHIDLNLHMFDGAAAGGAPAGASEGTPVSPTPTGSAQAAAQKGKPEKNPLSKVQYGKPDGIQQNTQTGNESSAKTGTETTVTTDTIEARKAAFEKFLTDNKDLDAERTQRIFDTRFKDAKNLEKQVKTVSPILEMLASKYGVDPQNPEALVKAIEEDDSYYEDEALKKGLTVQQLKEMKKLERSNKELSDAVRKQQMDQQANQTILGWQDQGEKLKKVYPDFDLSGECNDPETGKRFTDLLRANIDVKTAYELIHKDEIIGGAMQYTAQQIQQKTVNDIRARGLRPDENGTNGNAPSMLVKSDPSKHTKEDRAEIARRVARGERIVF